MRPSMVMVCCAKMVSPKPLSDAVICCGVTVEAICSITSSGENRVSPTGGMPEPGGSGITGMVNEPRVGPGAPLPPCLPLARLPASARATVTLSPIGDAARASAATDSSPIATAAVMSAAGCPRGIWKVKPPPLGIIKRVAAEAGHHRAVNCAYNSLPRYLRDSSASGRPASRAA